MPHFVQPTYLGWVTLTEIRSAFAITETILFTEITQSYLYFVQRNKVSSAANKHTQF